MSSKNINEDEELNSAVDAGTSDLTVIHEAAKLIGQAGTLEMAIGGILRLISQMLGLNRGRVLLPVPNDSALQIRYSYGLTEDERQRGVYAIGEGVTGRVMKTGQVAVIQNIDEEPLYLYRSVDRSTLPNDIVAYIAVPILDGETPIGVLAAHRIRLRRRAIDADLVVLRIIATFIAQILKINNLIEERTEHLIEENRELKVALVEQRKGHGILGESPAVRSALHQILQVADTMVTVLLTGESGTGKEKFSQMLHLNSARRDQPFLAINCAAIPEQLMESELFGHERGAFTGATTTKKGKVELANGGTLFLDEIGDLNLELQSKLLRVLERQVIQRVGGTKDIQVDVRIVAATHKNLQQAVNQGRFRLDLFYRLNVFPLHLPPLRDRDGDIRLLALHLLLAANKEYNRNAIFEKGVMERLENYNWPGNIRQLENVIKRVVLLNRDGLINVNDVQNVLIQEANIGEHLEAGQSGEAAGIRPVAEAGAGRGGANLDHRPYSWVNEDEAQDLMNALQSAGGNKTRAALNLGMTPRQYRYRMEKLGLEYKRPGARSQNDNQKSD